jgi:hypothetical protein
MSIGNPGVFVNNASLHTFGRILLAMGGLVIWFFS